jgi:hypothetical protein
MHAFHDQFSHQMRNRLKTTGMGLGLVRLLQAAGLIDEARTTLSSLENGFQGVALSKGPKTKKPRPMPIACLTHHEPWSKSCPSQRQ